MRLQRLRRGITYFGAFKSATSRSREGQGYLLYPTPDRFYIGDWKGGRRHGWGYAKGYVQKGDSYVGEWYGDKLNGQGTYVYGNGDSYVGAFRNSEFQGTGTLNKNSTGETYQGGWYKDKK